MWIVCIKAPSLELEDRRHVMPAAYIGIRIPDDPVGERAMECPTQAEGRAQRQKIWGCIRICFGDLLGG